MRRAMTLALVVGVLMAGPATAATIVDAAKQDGHFTKLLAASKAGGVDGALAGKGPFTLFAPDDNAFAKVPAAKLDALMRPANLTMLKMTLGAHLLTGVLDDGSDRQGTGGQRRRGGDHGQQHAARLQARGRRADRKRRENHQAADAGR